jgi:hypothetical protein
MVGRIVDVCRGLRHETMQDVQEVFGDTFLVGQDCQATPADSLSGTSAARR